MKKCFNGDGKHPRNEVADYWYRHGVRCERERIGKELKEWFNGENPELIEETIERITGIKV